MQHDLFNPLPSYPYEDTVEYERKRIGVAKVKGTVCKCCNSFLKVYHRRFHVAMAVTLIHLYKCKKDSWVNFDTLIRERNLPPSFRADLHKMLFWKLIEKKEGQKEDGNPNLGLYRITAKGGCFVRDEIKIPKYAEIYQDQLEGFSERMVSIKEALKEKFDYNSLMNS